MKYGHLVVEKKEFAMLQRLLSQSAQKRDSIYATSVAKLSQELRTASTVKDVDMPEEIVRLNSIITISTPMSKDKTFQLVMPEKSNIAENRLSILAPMGLALFGYATGDQVSWEFPSGINKIKIVKVEQPVLQP